MQSRKRSTTHTRPRTSRSTRWSTRRRTIPICVRSTGSCALRGDLRACRWADLRCPTSTTPHICRTSSGLWPHCASISISVQPFGRHAVRLAVTLAAAGVLADVLPIQRGYWITLTAALVLRPDFTTTFSRGVARIAGTIVGVVAATAIVVAVPNTPHITLGACNSLCRDQLRSVPTQLRPLQSDGHGVSLSSC